MWTQARVTQALRGIVAEADMKPQKLALLVRSLRTGGKTQLSASNVATAVLQREKRSRF